jgi:hypothetical protein
LLEGRYPKEYASSYTKDIDADNLTNRAKELAAAAKGIKPSSLEAAKTAVAFACEDYIRWADLFSERLETVKPTGLHKFARALCLTMLGYLPTRPNACPFCIQYGRDRSCRNCGYAVTHGRCDDANSAFSLFIEEFMELGRLIYQDTDELKYNSIYVKQILNITIKNSIEIAWQMKNGLPSATAMQLMQQKAAYLDIMINLLPVELLGEDVKERCLLVQKALLDYW